MDNYNTIELNKQTPTTGLIGAICGDIIGLPYEFRGTRTKDYNFPLKLNDFSDDTILTIAISQWLMGERTEDKLRQHLFDYAVRFKDKDVWGRGFMSWVESGGTLDRKGVASNGAAMRVTAIGYASDNLQEVLRLAEMSARITHDSDEAARGAQAVAAAVLMARTGHSKDEVRRYIEQTFNYNLSRKVEDIREDYQFEILCDRCVPEAIICWLQSNTYEEAVRNAVSLGGDADTLAAIAGGIAAATPGTEVPVELAQVCFNLLPDDFKDTLIRFHRPLILISNDDGYQAKGIRSLVDMVKTLGNVVVCAPEGPRSGFACAFSATSPLRLTLRERTEGVEIWSCNGTPVDCIKMALSEILTRKPDLVLGGINHGDNGSVNTHYSGTMGVVMEGCMKYIPSVAYSLCDHNDDADFEPLRSYVDRFTRQVLSEGLPQGVCLNINFPAPSNLPPLGEASNAASPLQSEGVRERSFCGVKVCRMAQGTWYNEVTKCHHPRGYDYYWMVGHYRNDEPEAEDTDNWALQHGYVAITPTRMDVTAYEAMDSLKSFTD